MKRNVDPRPALLTIACAFGLAAVSLTPTSLFAQTLHGGDAGPILPSMNEGNFVSEFENPTPRNPRVTPFTLERNRILLATPTAEDDPLFISPQVSIIRRVVDHGNPPRKIFVQPPLDLINHQGKPIDDADVLADEDAGMDTSTYDPDGTDIWGGDTRPRDIVYPTPGPDGYINLKFDSLLTTPKRFARARVTTDDAAETPYRFATSSIVHSALMNAFLMQKLGYTIDLPRHYFKARIRFLSKEDRVRFTSNLTDFAHADLKDLLIKLPAENDLSVEVRDFVLEPARVATPTYYWGATNKKELQFRRSVRALLVPSALTEIPESVNLWTWEVGKVINERILLFHPFAGNFQSNNKSTDGITYGDGRWIARKICGLVLNDLHEIVHAGKWPEFEPLVLEKLKKRRNHLCELFEIPYLPFPADAAGENIVAANGEVIVKDSKLLKGRFDGYAFPFMGRDPESPLRRDELFRYFKLRGLGTVLSAGLTQLNDRLLKLDKTDITKAGNENWRFVGGPGAKLDLSGTRKVSSGTFFGSESKIQLVDQVSLSATLAYFAKAQNRMLPDIDFSGGPNTVLSRSYTHAKPLASIEEALKTPWKDLPVITKMKSLAKLFDVPSDDAAVLDKQLTDFLALFVPNENFTFVDSIDLGASANGSMPLPPLVPGFGTSKLSLSAGYDHIIARRTMFQRQSDGRLQVTLQRVKRGLFDVSLTFNYLVDILSAAYSRAKADSDATVFVLDTNNKTTTTKILNQALFELLVRNDSTTLEANFQPYDLDHAMKYNTTTFKFLAWKAVNRHEEHTMVALPPGTDEDTAGTDRRELFSLRDRKLKGGDVLGFVTRTGVKVAKDAILPDIDLDTSALGEGSSGLDPSSSFLGKSHWHEVQLESELTPSRNARTQLSLQETYTGWTMKKARMLRIIRDMEDRAHEISDVSPSLIHPEEFKATSKLLLYQISSLIRISGQGLDQLVDLAQMAIKESAFRSKLVSERRISSDLAEPPEAGHTTESPYDFVPGLYKVLRKVPAPGTTVEENRERIRKLYAVGTYLRSEIDERDLLRLIGPDESIFQITVTGFRKNDENGDSSYISSSIGQTNPKVGEGAFSMFATEQAITPYEVRAKYLGDGL